MYAGTIKREKITDKTIIELSVEISPKCKDRLYVRVVTCGATAEEEDRNNFLSKYLYSRNLAEDYIKELKIKFFKEKLR